MLDERRMVGKGHQRDAPCPSLVAQFLSFSSRIANFGGAKVCSSGPLKEESDDFRVESSGLFVDTWH